MAKIRVFVGVIGAIGFILVATTQDDAIQAVSTFSDVSGRLVATALTLYFVVFVIKSAVVLSEIATPSVGGEQEAECGSREIERTKGR